MSVDRDTLTAVFQHLIVIDEKTDWLELEGCYQVLRKMQNRQAHQDQIDRMAWEGGICN